MLKKKGVKWIQSHTSCNPLKAAAWLPTEGNIRVRSNSSQKVTQLSSLWPVCTHVDNRFMDSCWFRLLFGFFFNVNTLIGLWNYSFSLDSEHYSPILPLWCLENTCITKLLLLSRGFRGRFILGPSTASVQTRELMSPCNPQADVMCACISIYTHSQACTYTHTSVKTFLGSEALPYSSNKLWMVVIGGYLAWHKRAAI